MKYTIELSIDMPREELIQLFDKSENLSEWQEGLKSIELLEGEYGKEGSTSRMVYAGRNSDLIIEGRVSKRNFPEEFCVTYTSKGVYNEVVNLFSEPETGRTHWKMINYFRFRGMMAVMAPFIKSAFTSNTLLNMERFKVFALQNKTTN